MEGKDVIVKQSSTQTKRLIYFRGHHLQPKSALITLICKQYETLSTILSLSDMECATRTLSNLYNLHAVRGNLNSEGELVLSSAMSGPHHYFGYIDPYAAHTVHIDPISRLPHYYHHRHIDRHMDRDSRAAGEDQQILSRGKNLAVPTELVTKLLPGEDFTWLSGLALSQAQERVKEKEKEAERKEKGKTSWVSMFRLSRRDEEESVMAGGVTLQKARTPAAAAAAQPSSMNSNTTISVGTGELTRQPPSQQQDITDSLFAYPGVLALKLHKTTEMTKNEEEKTEGHEAVLSLHLLEKGRDYDLSSFGAQLVPNDQPFRFDRHALDAHLHAQHKLRLITYNYGGRYVPDYLMKGNGVFIERHAFIQCITPLHENCGGFVILGREVKEPYRQQPQERRPQETGMSGSTASSPTRGSTREGPGGPVTGSLELVAVTIPLGQTLLVQPYALHGDSFLTGLYSMGMTGNHHAMSTADSVFLKHHLTGENVQVIATPPLFPNSVGSHTPTEQKKTPVPPSPQSTTDQTLITDQMALRSDSRGAVGGSDSSITPVVPLLTSDRLSLPALHHIDALVKAGITETIAGGEYSSDDDIRDHTTSLADPLAFAHKAVAQTRQTLWQPVIFTLPPGGRRGGEGAPPLSTGIKTLGGSLPPIL